MRPVIHLIRHGQSTFNVLNDATGEDPLHYDARLSPLGHEQAAATGKALADSHYDLVITSPLSRAIQTAKGIFGSRVPMIVNASHSEWMTWSCSVGRQATELSSDFPDLDFAHLKGEWWHMGGPINAHGIACEPEHSLMSRVSAFKKMIASRPESHIAVVGHGDFFYRLVGRHMKNCELVEWSHHP